jgi:predicted DNA-binding ArsR family transcriptional regulator
MYIEGELYEPNKISNKQLLVYGDGWLTDIGKLALQHAHKAVPVVGKVFKFFYDRRKRKQAEAEKNKMREHLMKMSADIRLKPEDRMKILDLLKEIKIEPHKYTNEQFHKLFDTIQKGVQLGSIAGTHLINKHEQSKEPKSESDNDEFHDAETGGKMYINPNKRRQQRQGKIPPKGNGFDEIVKLLKKNPEVAHKANKYNKKGLTITEADIQYIINLFKKHNIFDKNKKQLYTIKNDFFSLTKPSNKQYELNEVDKDGNILNHNIYKLKQGTYNASVNKVPDRISSVYDDLQVSPQEILSRLYESNEKLAENMGNIKDLPKQFKDQLMIGNKTTDEKAKENTTSEAEFNGNEIKKIKNVNYIDLLKTHFTSEQIDNFKIEYNRKKLSENFAKNLLEVKKGMKFSGPEINLEDKNGPDIVKDFYDNVKFNKDIKNLKDYIRSSTLNDDEIKKYENKIDQMIDHYTNVKYEIPLNTLIDKIDTLITRSLQGEIDIDDIEIKEIDSSDDEIDPNGHESNGIKGGKMYLRPSNRIKQRNGTIPPKGQGIDQHQAVTTLPFYFNDNKTHVHKHLPSMFSENHKGGGFLEAY